MFVVVDSFILFVDTETCVLVVKKLSYPFGFEGHSNGLVYLVAKRTYINTGNHGNPNIVVLRSYWTKRNLILGNKYNLS